MPHPSAAHPGGLPAGRGGGRLAHRGSRQRAACGSEAQGERGQGRTVNLQSIFRSPAPASGVRLWVSCAALPPGSSPSCACRPGEVGLLAGRCHASFPGPWTTPMAWSKEKGDLKRPLCLSRQHNAPIFSPARCAAAGLGWGLGACAGRRCGLGGQGEWGSAEGLLSGGRVQ